MFFVVGEFVEQATITKDLFVGLDENPDEPQMYRIGRVAWINTKKK